jgi:hypothetical protein
MQILTKIIGAVVLAISFVFFIAIITAIPVWLLWNWLIPIVFPGESIVHHITLMQAFGIAMLCSCLFKSSSSK